MSHPIPVLSLLRTLVGGTAAGAGVAAFGVLTFRALEPLGVGDNVQLVYVGLWILMGAGASAYLSWRLTQGIVTGWIRGVTTAASVTGGLMLAGASFPIDFLFPPVFLIAYLIILAAVAIAIVWYARRTGGVKP